MGKLRRYCFCPLPAWQTPSRAPLYGPQEGSYSELGSQVFVGEGWGEAVPSTDRCGAPSLGP